MKNYLLISDNSGKKGLSVSLLLVEDASIILSITSVGSGGCIDKGAKINILFTNGSRLELASDGDFNCKGKATVYFGEMFGKTKQLTMKQLTELKTKKIDILRVWTNESYVEEKFELEQAEQFLNALKCLTKNKNSE